MADTGRLDELKRKFDENPRRYFAPLANEYRKAGDFDRAIELCRAYLPHQPEHMSGYIVYAQALFDAHKRTEAAAIFQEALRLDPENIIALRHLGDIAREEGDRSLAMQWYGKVLELDPKNEEITGYITALATPGEHYGVQSEPVKEPRPAVHPEPVPDPNAVALGDLINEPDEPQPVFEATGLQATAESAFPSAPAFEHAPTFEIVPANEDVSPPAIPSFPPLVSDERVFEIVPPEDGAPQMTEMEAESTVQAMEEGLRDEQGVSEQGVSEQGVSELSGSQAGSPFVTETMAGLYLQQGLPAEALAVYRKLAETREDERLQAKIRELEIQLTPPKVETVREFFARIGARAPEQSASLAGAPESLPPDASPRDGLGALFDGAALDARDTRAAASLGDAFARSR